MKKNDLWVPWSWKSNYSIHWLILILVWSLLNIKSWRWDDFFSNLKTNSRLTFNSQINNSILPNYHRMYATILRLNKSRPRKKKVRQTAQANPNWFCILITKLAIPVRKSPVNFNLNAFRRDFTAALAGFLRSNCVIDGCSVASLRDYIFDALAHRFLPMCKTYPSHFLFHSLCCRWIVACFGFLLGMPRPKFLKCMNRAPHVAELNGPCVTCSIVNF